jgi:hypothetical protein
MTIRELIYFKAYEGDNLYIKAYDTIWEGVLYETDMQGFTIDEKGVNEWISFDDLEVWGRKDVLEIRLNGVKQNCSY